MFGSRVSLTPSISTLTATDQEMEDGLALVLKALDSVVSGDNPS